ncbi:CBS domain-containing protein [Lentzea nigeriaca]|uniref:CBS domain-containing protein n=1 Tax=Lentzea nigeriaca TaxID=1128665 RepID=UPI0019579D61|nr:CBS domain-containing protein [Lentzea nigeriaca]MBM7864411.1 CBS domain-containing protein [Lentzea nigeriaca]
MGELTTASVMCRRVVTAAPDTVFRDLVGMVLACEVSMVPVVGPAGRPLGVVSETDLTAKLEFRGGTASPPVLAGSVVRSRWQRCGGLLASELMVAPAITIGEQEPLWSALRVLTAARVDAACVVNDNGTLIGVLARRDALRVYLRDDAAIRADLERALVSSDVPVEVRVAGGLVTLEGTLCLRSATERAERIARAVAGVVGVRNNLGFDVDDLMITGL